MAWEALTVTHFLAAASMLLLAAWLLWLNFESRLHRGFALFLLLRGGLIVCNRLAALLPEARAFWAGLAGYLLLGVAFALAYFLVAYAGRDRTWRHAAAVAALVAGATLVEALYLVEHCLYRCTGPDGREWLGPLALVAYGLTTLYAFAGLVLARESVRAAQPARRDAAFLVAVAFLLQAVVEACIVIGLVLVIGPAGLASASVPNPWLVLAYVLRGGALLVALVGLRVLARRAGAGPARTPRDVALLALAAAASGLYQAVVPLAWPQLSLSATFLTGLWLMLLPALVTWSLVRHRLFDADVRVRRVVAKGPAAFAFLGVFFVGAQLAQNYLNETYGWVGGGVLAGLVLFALAPLQKLGERLAEGVAPGAKPISRLSHAERLELYRAQATLAWSDGSLGRKERFLLDNLRERLGLSLEETVHEERAAMGASTA